MYAITITCITFFWFYSLVYAVKQILYTTFTKSTGIQQWINVIVNVKVISTKVYDSNTIWELDVKNRNYAYIHEVFWIHVNGNSEVANTLVYLQAIMRKESKKHSRWVQ